MNLVDQEQAAKIAKLGFPEGGYRFCRKDKRFQKVTLAEIQSWPQLKPPNCKLCESRTELLTPGERERMK